MRVHRSSSVALSTVHPSGVSRWAYCKDRRLPSRRSLVMLVVTITTKIRPLVQSCTITRALFASNIMLEFVHTFNIVVYTLN